MSYFVDEDGFYCFIVPATFDLHQEMIKYVDTVDDSHIGHYPTILDMRKVIKNNNIESFNGAMDRMFFSMLHNLDRNFLSIDVRTYRLPKRELNLLKLKENGVYASLVDISTGFAKYAKHYQLLAK